MYRTGILNSEISKVLSDLGHTDMIMIADCGLPVPKGIKKIDLAVRQGLPSFIDVVNEVEKHMVVERIVLAHEIKQVNSECHKDILKCFHGTKVQYTSHEELKELSQSCKAIIRTGEATPFANIILQSGVNF